jgi:NADPH:quinone reductase-like Zn-dependent oxidoreductase
VFGYDAPQTIGLLAKRNKVHKSQILPIPRNTRHSLQQWAGVSIRYATAYANWRLAYGCWLLQVSEDDSPAPWVWGWGGGVSLAELCLAKMSGCRVAMIASNERRLEQARSYGITPIDRRQFSDLNFDEAKYEPDRQYRARYLTAESAFLDVVERVTEGRGVAVFIDNIGTPVFRATLKALARQGVVTTSGWKHGMSLSVSRASECINRHIHVHSHGTRDTQAATVMAFCEETGWLPPLDSKPYTWDQVPQLARDYAENRIDTYFPVFQVNEL